LPENNKGEEIGQPSVRLKKTINKVIGNVYKKKVLSEKLPNTTIQTVTVERTWHIKNRHGEGKEKLIDQISITKDTFMLIPDVLENFDSVEIARDTWERNRRKPSVTISRHYSDGTIIVADAIIDENTLKIKTMWIEKTGCGKT